MRILAIAHNTFREALRNKILYSVVFFAFCVTIISALFGSVSIGDQVKVIKDFGLFSVSFFGAIICMLAGVNLLNKELKQKTIHNILSKPVARYEFIIGKHLGLAATVSVLVMLMGLLLVGFTALFEGHIDRGLLQGVVFAIFEIWVIAAVTIFFSTLVVTTTLTAIFSLATYVAGRSVAYLDYFKSGPKEDANFLSGLIAVLDVILPDLSVFNVNDAVVYGTILPFPLIAYAACYALSYSALLLLGACFIFQRRELL